MSFIASSHAVRVRLLDTCDHHRVASGPVGYRLAKRLPSRPLRQAYDVEVRGRIPDGPAILAANHRSFMDSVFLAAVVDQLVTFLAKAEYFERRACQPSLGLPAHLCA